MKKKLICSIMICATVLAGFQAIPITYVLAAEQDLGATVNDVENIGSFTENLEEYEYIEKKVEDEVAEKEFGEEHEEVEAFLNENGVFDEEIKELGLDNKFDEIEEKGINNVSIQSGYYAVDDSCVEELENNDEKEEIDEEFASDMIQLNQDEVEQYIAEEYYGKDTGIMDEMGVKLQEGEDQRSNSFLRAIGLESKEAFASEIVSGGGNVSLLKKTVIVIKENSRYAKVQVYFEWTKMPVNRNLDSIGIIIDGAKYPLYDSDDTYKKIIARHEYKSKIQEGYVNCPGKTHTEKIDMRKSEKKLKKDEYYAESRIIEAAISLHQNNEWLMYNGDVHKETIMNEHVYFEFYVKLDNPDQKMIVIKPDYVHVKQSRERCDLVSVAVSIVNRDYLGATYYLAKGVLVSNVSQEHSGSGLIRYEMAVAYK